MWLELRSFAKDIKTIEGLLYEIAAYDGELKSFGLRYILRRIQTDGVQDSLEEFSKKLAMCTHVAPLIDKPISVRLKSLLSATNIEDLITQLSVRIKIAEKERPRPLAQGIAAYAYLIQVYMFRFDTMSLFADKSIKLESVLASLSSLRTLIQLLEEQHYRRTSNDDEIFKTKQYRSQLRGAPSRPGQTHEPQLTKPSIYSR